MKTKRKAIPKALDHQVRDQCDGACANPSCREWASSTHELHHIDGDRANSVLDNLILLCANCHSREQAGIITGDEIQVWKSRAKIGNLPLPKAIAPPSPSVGTNYGIVAERIEKLTVNLAGGKPNGPVLLAGTIGANPDMREYANYLVARYIDWRKKSDLYWPPVKGKRFKGGAAHGILCQGYKSVSALRIPDHRFFEWVEATQGKIDNTIFGKHNSKNYSTWEEFLQERHGKNAKPNSQGPV
jgi:hypothetical protein